MLGLESEYLDIDLEYRLLKSGFSLRTERSRGGATRRDDPRGDGRSLGQRRRKRAGIRIEVALSEDVDENGSDEREAPISLSHR